MMPLDATILGVNVNTIAALAAVGGVIVAIFTLRSQAESARKALSSQAESARDALGVDILFRLIDRWGSDEMAKKRAAAAKGALAGIEILQTDDVLGFFEYVGYLLGDKAIKPEGVWVNLSYDAINTWYAYKPFIDADQNADKTFWEDYQKLEAKMEAESRRRKEPEDQIVPDDQDKIAFLESEASLDVTP